MTRQAATGCDAAPARSGGAVRAGLRPREPSRSVWRNAAALGLSLLLAACQGHRADAGPVSGTGHPVTDPRNARFQIEDRVVALRAGRAASPAAPGSATLARTRILEPIVHGDLDADGDTDAVLWLLDAPGGSGSFLYLATAMREGDGYLGSAAIFVGDRLVPGVIRIDNGVVRADYQDRRPAQAMAAPPSVPRTAYLTWEGQGLRRWPEVAGAEFLQGWLTIGHEVRAFRACGETADLWLSGSSAALGLLEDGYAAAIGARPAYAPLFVSVLGRRVVPAREGFGADYRAALTVEALLKIWPGGACTQ